MSVANELSHTKTRYRELFAQAREVIDNRLLNALAESHPNHWAYANQSVEALLPEIAKDDELKQWARSCIPILETDLGGKILAKLNQINTDKQTYNCHQCGVCCRFASSEFSYDELTEKAANGDEFAKQFTSVFLPYASSQAAREKFPSMVDDVVNHTDDDVYFYHCPYLGEDNRCTLWGNPKRPQLCSNYPDTPLTFIYKNCAWKPWKDSNHDEALYAHAFIEICGFYVGKFQQALT